MTKQKIIETKQLAKTSQPQGWRFCRNLFKVLIINNLVKQPRLRNAVGQEHFNKGNPVDIFVR
jgi:hypothetical protein